MSFSDIKIYPVQNNSVIKANGSFVYNDAVQISCSVVNGKNGLFVSLPREKYKDKTSGEDKWANKVTFKTRELQDQLNEAVVAAYRKQVGGGDTQGTSSEPAPQTKRKTTIPF